MWYSVIVDRYHSMKAAPHPPAAATQVKLTACERQSVPKHYVNRDTGQASHGVAGRARSVRTIFLKVGEGLRPRRLQVGHIRVFTDHGKRVESELVGAPVSWSVQRVVVF